MRERVVPKIDQILSKQEKFSFKIHSLFYLFLSTGSNSGASSSSSAEKSQSFPQTAFSPLSLSKKKNTSFFLSLYLYIFISTFALFSNSQIPKRLDIFIRIPVFISHYPSKVYTWSKNFAPSKP